MKKIVKLQLKLAVPLIVVGGFFAYYIYSQVFSGLNTDVVTTEENQGDDFYKRLDGTVSDKDNENLLPVAVMIENHIASRPQSGLSRAKIVYEILVESDITRFVAIYDLTEGLDKIGPVRSARSYLIDIAGEYGAVYSHSGGSPDSLSILRRTDLVFNLDEFFGYNTGYYFRDNNRYAPHNLYTSSELLLSAKEHYQLSDDSNFDKWKLKDGSISTSDEEISISIDYSNIPTHQVIWKYIKDYNKYERWQNNNRHIDADGSVIEVDNIIVQYADTKVIDSIGRKDINLIGSGMAVIFRDGITIEGSWRKKLSSQRTKFYDEGGNEIELNRGITWIQVVPTEMEIIY
jgi:hypothetical protein